MAKAAATTEAQQLLMAGGKPIGGKPKRKRKPLPPVSRCIDWINEARSLLQKPPPPGVERPEARGELVACFGLPLDLCLPQDRRRQLWMALATRKDLLELMNNQALALGWNRIKRPLSGRPQVLCVRFSAGATDAYADWAKTAVDILCPSVTRTIKKKNKKTGKVTVKTTTANGLGLIGKDTVTAIDEKQWSEPARMGHGFCYIEIRTGVSQ